MADEELDPQVAPDEGNNAETAPQETAEQQARREDQEGKLDSEGNTDGSGGEQDSQDDGEDAAAKRSKRVQKRIDQLTKQRHEALREAEELRTENRKLKQSQKVEPPADDPRPSFDSYDSVEKYEQDIESWSRRQAQREAQAAPDEKSGQSIEQQEAIDRIQNAAIEASDRYPDFEQVVYDPSLPLTQEMIRAAAETESVADVLYHLGKNPQEAQRLSQMNGTSLVREIGRLEAKLETSSGNGADASGVDPSTSAPDPIQPVSGKRGKREPKNPDELDIDTWMERERERLAKQRR